MNKNHTTQPVKGDLKTRKTGNARNKAAAIRAQKRNHDDAQRLIDKHADASQKPRQRANKPVDANNKLKVTFLGGLEDVGEKNITIRLLSWTAASIWASTCLVSTMKLTTPHI
jgi:hypothetical protein